MNKKFLWGVIVVVLIAIIGFSFSNKKQSVVTNTQPIKFGVSTFLTGGFAAGGENIANTAKLVVQEINDKGGINGRKIELTIEDAGLDSKTGLAAAQKLVNADEIKYIVGGTASNGTLAAAPIVNNGKVLYLTPVTGGTNIDNAGPYVFRLANSDLLGGKEIAQAMKKLGFKKVAVVAEVTDYTLDLKKSFESEAKNLGEDVVISEEFQPSTSDFRTLVTKVKKANPEAVFIASQTGIGGANLVKQMREQGLNPAIFSDFTFVLNDGAKKIINSFEGIYFADLAYDENNSDGKAFLAKYEATYGKPSLIPFHAAATYDSIMLMAKGVEAVGDNSEKVSAWMNSEVKNYKGLMGTYSLDKDGNSDLGFVVKVIKDGKAVVVK